MKKLIILGSLFGLLLISLSCRNEFLESKPTETLANPPAQAKLYGLYLMMINTGTGGTTGHDDFGQKGYDIYSDMLSSDMVLSGVTYGWYRNIANLVAPNDYTNNSNYIPWRYYYRIIYAANDVIAGLGGNNAIPSDKNGKYAIGQAKAMRAYAYFYLSQYFNTKYDPSAASIPLYIDTSVVAKPKAKQSEVYAQIIKDLTESIVLLDGYSRPNKGIVNKYVALGLLAYTYAAMGENSKAAIASQDIINNFPITTREQTVYSKANKSGGGFNDLKTDSWMWGFDIATVNDFDLVSWWGQMDVFSYSYSWAGDPKSVDLGLYASIKDNDIRKEQFVTIIENSDGSYETFPADQDGDYKAVPANKFYASQPERELGGQRVITADYLFMRADEFYLLAAETLAKSGNETLSKTILKKFLSNRLNGNDAVDYIDDLSGNSLLDEIYLQTRIEFWGEGKSYLAMKRNKATIKRGSNHLFFAGQSFNYDDGRLTFDIPQTEINNNPYLK